MKLKIGMKRDLIISEYNLNAVSFVHQILNVFYLEVRNINIVHQNSIICGPNGSLKP